MRLPSAVNPLKRRSNRLNAPFAAKYKGRDIWDYTVKSSNITYSQELHWRIVAKWNDISFKKFMKLEGDEQSRLVAAYETVLQMDAVSADQAQKEANRKGKRGRS